MSSLKSVIHALPDAQIIETSRVTAVTTGIGGLVASMAQWNWTATIGAMVAVLSFAINWYFSYRRHRTEKVESHLRQALLKAQIDAYKDNCNYVQRKE